MLNDREQRTLADIEAQLRYEDPRLVHHLTGRTPPRITRRMAALTAVLLSLAVGLGELVAGPPAAIAAGLTVCAVLSGLLLQRRSGAQATGVTGEDNGRLEVS